MNSPTLAVDNTIGLLVHILIWLDLGDWWTVAAALHLKEGVACSGKGDFTKGSLRLLTNPSFFFMPSGKGCLAAGAICK